MHLSRDKDTGKSKGFAFLKYEDQRSTELAVDNLGGSSVLGRILRVDHTRYKSNEDGHGDRQEPDRNRERKRGMEEGNGENESPDREMIKEEKELQKLIAEHDEEDPMKEFLVQEKKQEILKVMEKREKSGVGRDERKHRHKHRSRDHGERHSDRRERPDRQSTQHTKDTTRNRKVKREDDIDMDRGSEDSDSRPRRRRDNDELHPPYRELRYGELESGTHHDDNRSQRPDPPSRKDFGGEDEEYNRRRRHH